MDAPAKIQYFNPPYAAHLTLFHCTRLHSDITPAACGKRHAAQNDYPCADCPTGALHAAQFGERVTTGKTRPSIPRPCNRCGRPGFRLISGRLCPSCWNREREWRIGQNRKGGRPTIRLVEYEALVVAPGGLVTRPHSGMAAQELGGGDFEIRMLALDEIEVKRTISSIWPGAEIVAVGPTGKPGLDDQRRSSARQAERMPGSEIA